MHYTYICPQIHLYHIYISLYIYNMYIIHLYLIISNLLLLAYNCIFSITFLVALKIVLRFAISGFLSLIHHLPTVVMGPWEWK